MHIHEVLHGLFALHGNSQAVPHGAVGPIGADQVFTLQLKCLARAARNDAFCSNPDMLWCEGALLDTVSLEEVEDCLVMATGLVGLFSQDGFKFILGQVSHIARRALPKQIISALELVDSMQLGPRQRVAVREVPVLCDEKTFVVQDKVNHI